MSLTDKLVRDINLPGSAERPIWSYNPLLECYWAALGRDEDRTDDPLIESSAYHQIPTMALLKRLLADAPDLRSR